MPRVRPQVPRQQRYKDALVPHGLPRALPGARSEAGGAAWAAPATTFTRDFTLPTALMAMRLNRQAAAELMRVDWSTAQDCISSVRDMIKLEPKVRYKGLVHIGIDETSYDKGHKRLTTVVNHDTGTVVLAADGHDAGTLSGFFEGLTEEQRAGIKCVTADAPRGSRPASRSTSRMRSFASTPSVS